MLADLVSGPFAHLPYGKFTANAAWLALAAIARNLLCAAGCLAAPRHARARGATIRADLFNVAARLARRGRGRLTLHLPAGWHHEHEWLSLFPGRLRATARPCGLTSPTTRTRNAPRPPRTHPRRSGQAAEQASGRPATPAASAKITPRCVNPGNDH